MIWNYTNKKEETQRETEWNSKRSYSNVKQSISDKANNENNSSQKDWIVNLLVRSLEYS